VENREGAGTWPVPPQESTMGRLVGHWSGYFLSSLRSALWAS